MDPATQQVVDSIPRFTIPAKDIITSSRPPAGEAQPPAPAPATTSAPPAATPKGEAPPAASETATPPETPPADAKAPEEKAPEKETTGKDPESERKASRSYERRVDRLTRQREEQRLAREAAERELAELRAKQAPPADPDEPRAEQFTDIEEFKKAAVAYGEKKAERQREKTQREEAQKQHIAHLSERWEEVADEGTAKYPDFHEKVGDLKPGVAAWSDAIIESENGHDVAMHLATNPKEAERIVALPPHRQFLEIGKLSAKLAAAPAPVKTPSKAPPPIVPESGAASAPDNDPFKPQPFESYMRSRPKEFSGGYR